MELQNFSQLIVNSWLILILISFCKLFVVDLVLGSCVLIIIQPPKPTFVFDEI